MNHTPRITRALLALILFLLTGCAGEGQPVPEEEHIIVLWHAFAGAESQALQALTDQFNADNDLNIVLLTEYQQLVRDLQSMPYAEYLQTDHWKRVRRKALDHAEYRCARCGASNTVLDVHHLSYKNRGCERNEDLVVLCSPCHNKTHNEEQP